MPPRVLATMVTTTSYGTWLPGDFRGYVENGEVLPPNPHLLAHARSLLAKPPVQFNPAEQHALFDSIRAAAAEFAYKLTDVSIESWHLHWIVDHGVDPVKIMVGRLKTRMRQALDRGRIWTEGYWHDCLYTEDEVRTRRRYITRHAGTRMVDGKLVRR